MHDSPGRYRSLFISDVHLGSAGCRAGLLLEFLARACADTLFLVGDIVDAQRLSQRFYWPQVHNDVLQTLFTLARRGTRVVYVPGNHDSPARAFCGSRFGRVEIRRQAVHRTAAGRRLLVLHGDEFDRCLNRSSALNNLGALIHNQLLRLNGNVNDWRQRAGLGYWPIAASLKHRSRRAQAYIADFRRAAVAHTAARGFDGCITGHIHRPEIIDADGIEYMNCGDWVEHCTALAEHGDGRMELIDWAGAHRALYAPARPTPLPQAA